MNDGGPAFPRHYGTASNADRVEQLWHSGMSLRDYFAAAALTGFCSRADFLAQLAVDDAYAVADAMLIERNRRFGTPVSE